MNAAICWLNGDLLPIEEARISPLDRGLLYGDGVFETMRAYGGVIFRLDQHVCSASATASASCVSPRPSIQNRSQRPVDGCYARIR